MKLVKENLNFERGSNDKLRSLNVGKIMLIKKWLDDYLIKNYIINEDLSISGENIYIYRQNIKHLPDFIEFRDITGYCDIKYLRLTSLRGFPKTVNGYFDCRYNGLESLDYLPKYIGTQLYCSEGNNISNDEYKKTNKIKFG